MSNFREMAPERLFEKIFKLLKYEHIIYHFKACGPGISNIYNYFREIFKFRDFMNTLRNFAKSVFVHILLVGVRFTVQKLSVGRGAQSHLHLLFCKIVYNIHLCKNTSIRWLDTPFCDRQYTHVRVLLDLFVQI